MEKIIALPEGFVSLHRHTNIFIYAHPVEHHTSTLASLDFRYCKVNKSSGSTRLQRPGYLQLRLEKYELP